MPYSLSFKPALNDGHTFTGRIPYNDEFRIEKKFWEFYRGEYKITHSSLNEEDENHINAYKLIVFRKENEQWFIHKADNLIGIKIEDERFITYLNSKVFKNNTFVNSENREMFENYLDDLKIKTPPNYQLFNDKPTDIQKNRLADDILREVFLNGYLTPIQLGELSDDECRVLIAYGSIS